MAIHILLYLDNKAVIRQGDDGINQTEWELGVRVFNTDAAGFIKLDGIAYANGFEILSISG